MSEREQAPPGPQLPISQGARQVRDRAMFETLGTLRRRPLRARRGGDDPAFAMDIEFKIDADGAFVVKQARPWVD